MKKLSILIALCMLLTVGGVYATWIYSEGQIDTQFKGFSSGMGGIDHEGNSGLYEFTLNGLSFTVEPNTQKDKITTIVWAENGTMTLTFTPKGDITDAMLAKALNATLTVEFAAADVAGGTYDNQTIFTINPDYKIELTADDWQEQTSENGTYYTYTITKDTMADSISVGSFHLPTEDEYHAFSTAMQSVKFAVRVTPAA